MSSFLTYLINGLSLGSIYAIIALGYTMVYGIAKMLNFAHGDFIMVGCYIIFSVTTTFSGNSIVGVLVAIVLCTLLGITTEFVAYRPLRGAASPLAVLITAIGVSYFLENVALLIFGADVKSFTSVIKWEGITFNEGEQRIQGVTIVAIVISVVVLIALQLFIKKTKQGQAMLAVAEDKGAAVLMGINVNRTIMLTFAIGSALAAIAGALLCSAYPSLSPYTGAMPGIKAFVAAVLGGIGSIPGAMIGGLLLGIVEILSKTYISSQLSDAIVFGILVVVLLVKPTGILGKKIQEKV
ncbi:MULTISPECIES: branched-chain amino acid ABC transporter permease [unclassified Butyrivibrio]|jgi:branched-chain amino acid transport system permease protein|uniref:branched-chain amino acid ABC transporter permease n=1 Tax=unclassified Butyrivibrio TaxID=2639466 RepID=UPI0003F9DE26|nr:MULTISPECIES: branched-chain amino acid ABC transporter permease [unclassified Butyrivibrio]SCY40104.1 branched-chain amino acid transport system permease protein [Butyrivibrio sp. INlla14]